MPRLLAEAPPTPAEQAANDRHRPLVVLAVVGMLLLYAYLFTYIADVVGLPRPQVLAEQVGLSIPHVFDSDHNVDSNVTVPFTQRFDTNDDERLVLYGVILVAFLGAYFLPLKWKEPWLTVLTAIGITLLYGPTATAALLASHLVIFVVLHPARDNLPVAAAIGWLTWAAFLSGADGGWTWFLPAPLLGMVLYRYAVYPLACHPRCGPVLRTLVIQSAIITVVVSSVVEGLGGGKWSLPLGILLFFWQWQRLIFYHIDYKDGRMPKEMRLWDFLAVFWSPGALPQWNWATRIGRGYSYCRSIFLCEEKNRIVISGLRLLGIALFYLVSWNWIRHLLVDFFEGLGIEVFNARIVYMVRHFVNGGEVSTPSVLLTSLLDLVRWFLMWGGVLHFKVGIWRICGYRMDSCYQRPWLSTNLITLWARYTVHYREFLVRAFYYPVFFRWFKQHPKLRIFTATMAAAALGNLVWGHLPEGPYYQGMEFESLIHVLRGWPYFILLGLGISVTQLYLLRKRSRRKPWTWDRWFLMDIICAYYTLQYFALIHIFNRPIQGSTTWDHLRLVLIGFGIHL